MQRRAVLFGVVLLVGLVLGLAAPRAAETGPDYRGMVERIGAFLDDALKAYRTGDAAAAKAKVQAAYFEVFENLEGPIRVNVSARKNIELEAAFGDIRKMFGQGIALADIEARVAAHMAELRRILPELEGGHRITAQGAVSAPAPAARPPAVEPAWAQAVERVRATLERAAAAMETGNADGARALVVEAQYEGYKNSLLETAVRRHVSKDADAAFNAEFARIAGLARDGEPAAMIRASAVVLVGDLGRVLPGLPLVGGGPGPTRTTTAAVPEGDWRAVADRIGERMREAVALHRAGQREQAVSTVQDTYFDVFEASGLEGRIGARDAAFMAQLEGHFSKVAGLVKTGAPTEAMEAALAAMAADFDRAVTMLAKAADSPWALFVYALTIILREGFEAILIVTAILAYLTKTGNQDKRRVIHNSVAVALVASLATAVLLKGVFDASAAGQEVLEGATMLLAAVVLFSMSWWLISKAEAQRWMAYIRGKVDASLGSGSLGALWLASFLAVYREGAETVLFFQALTASNDGAAGTTAIVAGLAVGCVGLVGIYAVLRAGALRLAIRPFFLATGALLYAMAFVFAGKGMMELIEGRLVEPTLVSWLPEIPVLGVFPYWQTFAPQGTLIAAAALAAAVLLRQRVAAAASARAE